MLDNFKNNKFLLLLILQTIWLKSLG